jgi:hypothetical protein
MVFYNAFMLLQKGIAQVVFIIPNKSAKKTVSIARATNFK